MVSGTLSESQCERCLQLEAIGVWEWWMWGFTGEAMTALAAVCVCTCYTMAVIFSHMFTLFIQFHFLLILSLFCVWESTVDWMHACMRAQLLQLCPALYDPWTVAHQAPLTMGILQARILE